MFDDDHEPFPLRQRGRQAEHGLEAIPVRAVPNVFSNEPQSPAAPALGRGRTRRKAWLTVGRAASTPPEHRADSSLLARGDAAVIAGLPDQRLGDQAYAALAVEHHPNPLPLSMANSSAAGGPQAVRQHQLSEPRSQDLSVNDAEASGSDPVRKRKRGAYPPADKPKSRGVSRAEGADGGTRAAGRKKGDHRVKRHDGMPDTPAWLDNIKSVTRK